MADPEIPAAAVQAAARALLKSWHVADDEASQTIAQRTAVRDARTALHAAVPYLIEHPIWTMMRRAAHEGRLVGVDEHGRLVAGSDPPAGEMPPRIGDDHA